MMLITIFILKFLLILTSNAAPSSNDDDDRIKRENDSVTNLLLEKYYNYDELKNLLETLQQTYPKISKLFSIGNFKNLIGKISLEMLYKSIDPLNIEVKIFFIQNIQRKLIYSNEFVRRFIHPEIQFSNIFQIYKSKH